MTFDLSGKTAIVTGAGSGLGQAMTLGLVRAGANVLGLDVAEDRLAETASLAKGSGTFKGQCCDVRHLEHCGAAVATALETFGGLHGVYNCAGIGMAYLSSDYHTKPVRYWEADPQRWQDVIDVNLRGPFLLARAATPHLLAQKWGRVVNVTTSFNTMIRGANMPYGQSKAGLEAASASWAEDTRDTGITVNVLIPGGAADTRLVPQDAPYDRTTLIKPDVMIAPAVWLLSEASDGVTGMRFIGQLWDPQTDWKDAMRKSASPAAWPDLAAAAAAAGQPTPPGGFRVK